jgi:signal transduction histidine kinase
MQVRRASAGDQLPADGEQAQGSPPAEHFEPADNGRHRADGAAAYPRWGPPPSLRALKNWRVRSRLLLLVAIPTVTAVALGGVRIVSSVRSGLADQRVVQLADLSGEITGLVQALQDERQDTITFITLGDNGGRGALASKSALGANARLALQVLNNGDYAVSSRLARQVRSQLGVVGAGYSELAQQDASAAAGAIDGLGALRTEATRSQLPAPVVIQEYTDKINTLLALDDQAAVGSSDSTLVGEVRVLGLISAMKEEASEQQALITGAQSSNLIGVSSNGLNPSVQTTITDAEAELQSNEAQFNAAATASQRQLLTGTLSAPTVAGAQAQVQQAISLASSASSAADPAIGNAVSSLATVADGMRSVETRLVQSVVSRSTSLRDGAVASVIIGAVAVLLVLALALIFTIIVGRSMVGPLRRLRTGALDVAGVRLPETVRLMSETDGEGVSLDVEPIDVDSSDEIGEVARAFDQVHQEAIRLAANEAALRGNINAMFVNLSRRSQSLVERQIRLIDGLEQGEQDSERLASLFQMDHLATRLRRNSENLLVLAGQDLSRRWNRPVALVDVLRAAISEIERYERVTLNAQPGIAVRTAAVSDVVHLTAELVENATSFSAANTEVTVAGHLLSSGGVLLEITDHGVGMGTEEMAHANWRLDNPPVVDVAVSRRMGLFVVARLAARHGIRVRLRPEPAGGLVALVWLPDETITRESPGSPPGMPRRRPAENGAADGPALAGTRDGGRTTVEHEVNAARAPRFTPLRADGNRAAPELPRRRRASGAVAPPGDASAPTGPLPAFRSGRLAASDPEDGVAAPLQTSGLVSGDGDQRLGTDSPAAGIGGPAAGISALAGGQADTPAAGFGSLAGGQVDSPPAGIGSRADSQADQPFGASREDSASQVWGVSRSPGGVIVPPAETLTDRSRLPIFEAVESDWFRRGRRTLTGTDPGTGTGGWASPADDGWRAAEVVHAPASGGTTPAGLPKRIPKANLVPGAAPTAGADRSVPTAMSARSPAATRDRFARYQRGVRRGRAAAGGIGPDSGGDKTQDEA